MLLPGVTMRWTLASWGAFHLGVHLPLLPSLTRRCAAPPASWDRCRRQGPGPKPAGRIFLTGRRMSQPRSLRQPCLLAPRNALASCLQQPLVFSPAQAAPSSQVQTAKGLGNFRETLKPGREPEGNSSARGRGCLGDDRNMAFLRPAFLSVRGPAARSPPHQAPRAGGGGGLWPGKQRLLWASLQRPQVLSQQSLRGWMRQVPSAARHLGGRD